MYNTARVLSHARLCTHRLRNTTISMPLTILDHQETTVDPYSLWPLVCRTLAYIRPSVNYGRHARMTSSRQRV